MINTDLLTKDELREAKEAVEEKYAGVETNITYRWQDGTPHHPGSVRLMEALGEIDFHLAYDHFCWKWGGDGDDGESLMYELDIIFEKRDLEASGG